MIKLAKRNGIYVIFSLILCGMILVYFYNNPSNTTESEGEGYKSSEEKRIKDLVESLEGISDASVMVNFESVTKTDLSLSGDEIVAEPVIKGIAISVKGGDDPLLSEKIKSLICAAYDINDSMIYVCGK